MLLLLLFSSTSKMQLNVGDCGEVAAMRDVAGEDKE